MEKLPGAGLLHIRTESTIAKKYNRLPQPPQALQSLETLAFAITTHYTPPTQPRNLSRAAQVLGASVVGGKELLKGATPCRASLPDYFS